MTSDETNSSVRKMIDEVCRLTASIFESRANQRPLAAGLDPRALAARFDEKIPYQGMPVRDVLRLVEEEVIPAALNLANPLTFGLMTPHPLPLPAVLDGLISALNQNLGCAWRTAPSGIEVELRTISWLCQLCGLPPGSGGHFTTGGTTSNLTAIRLALHRGFPEARARGLVGFKNQPVLYVSDQGHFSIDRAAGVLGLGEQNVRKVPSRADLTMDVNQLARQIQHDRQTGLAPFAVIGTAGTTANGTIDPLTEVSNICGREDLWFHVDAAYAGALVLSERFRQHLQGIEKADSITLDPHKWMFIPFSLGALLTRHRYLLCSAFGQKTAYLGDEHITQADAAPSGFYEVSLDGSRRFNGLKLWAAMKHLGISGLARLVERQVDLAQFLYERLADVSGIELAPRSPTNIVCFRVAPAGTDEATRNLLQAQFQQRLEDAVGCWLSNVTIQQKHFLRVNLLHYGLEGKHVDRLLTALEAEVKGWLDTSLQSKATAE
jgi:glutamate/tyrosine decarboxylase-like PLP-dependent enzyme